MVGYTAKFALYLPILTRYVKKQVWMKSFCWTNLSIDFLTSYKHPESAIDVQLDSQVKSEIERNRRYLRPIVDTVIFTAKLGLAFRGHRDSGQIQVAGSVSDINYTQGNLRALLQFKATGDPDLREHLTACKLNAQYVGHNSQNENIQCIGDYITEKIVDQIKITWLPKLIDDFLSIRKWQWNVFTNLLIAKLRSWLFFMKQFCPVSYPLKKFSLNLGVKNGQTQKLTKCQKQFQNV